MDLRISKTNIYFLKRSTIHTSTKQSTEPSRDPATANNEKNLQSTTTCATKAQINMILNNDVMYYDRLTRVYGTVLSNKENLTKYGVRYSLIS